MSLLRKQQQAKKRRALRVRNSIKSVGSLPRISVFRSLKHMYAQLIDDSTGTTIASSSSRGLAKVVGDKKEAAVAVGLDLAQRAKSKGVLAACFDRGPFKYHGRVAAVARGLRDGGLKI